MNATASRCFLALGAFLLSACTTVDYDFADVKKSGNSMQQMARPSGAVNAPRFGDRKPFEWTGRTPWIG